MSSAERDALIIDDFYKLRLLSYLLSVPITPAEFRKAIDKEPAFVYAGLMYDAFLGQAMRRSRKAILAERRAMISTKQWWIDSLDKKTLNMLEQAYYAGMAEKIIIKTDRNMPYGKKDWWTIMKTGCPIFDLHRVLCKVYPEEAADIIVEKIKALGSRGVYEVRFVRSSPTAMAYDIAVREVTDF